MSDERPVPERRREGTPMNEPGDRISTDGSSGTGTGVFTNGIDGAARRRRKARALVALFVASTLALAAAFFFRGGTARVSLAGKARTVTIAGSAAPKEVTALAERLCSALHRTPAERVAACCG